MALFYVDASALVKLVREEPESSALSAYLEGADLVSSELVLAEVPRAIRRAATDDPSLSLDVLIEQAKRVLEAVATTPASRDILATAGGLPESALRALDAIHVASALALSPLDGFITYDERQGAAARLAGLRTVTPIPPGRSELASRIAQRGSVELSQPSEATVREIRDCGD